MNPEPDDIGANDELEAASDHEDLPLRLTEFDQHLREALAALRKQSNRLASIEQRVSVSLSGTVIAPETNEIWKDTVRRFTASIDVRLDILENELGGIQDELNRLRQETLGRTDAVQRRLVRLYATGQVFLGVLIVVLFLVGWSAAGKDAEVGGVEPSTTGSTSSSTTPGPAVKTSPAVPQTVPEHVPQGEVRTGAAAAVAPAQEDEPTAPLGVGDRQVPSTTEEGKPAPSLDIRQPQQAKEESEVPDNDSLAVLAEDTESTPEAAAKIVVPTEGHFAIQLITFQSVSRVESFAKEFGIVDNSRYMRVEHSDRFLYSVLLGNYSTREEGRAAVDALSPRLRELDPWVRWLPSDTRLMSVEAPPEAASSE